MARIHILPEHEARKIAAGEVVERPASVVKELLENALDAEASEITVSLWDGGKERIIISDNGCGMTPEDARLCIEHHATSKIRSVDELVSISTFGFRGEALSSIASVSLMTLITRDRESPEGYELHLECGRIVREGPISANYGTQIIVENLFYNVPARRKFLKQRETEWRSIQQLVTAYAFAFPHIGFTLHHDTSTYLNVLPRQTMVQRAEHIVRQNTIDHVIEIPFYEHKNIAVTGALCSHHHTRYDRRFMMSFVNQRWVKNHGIGKAVLAGYHNILPSGKYPYAFISLTIPLHEVDVNIHPRKEEVMLLHPYVVADAVEAAVHATLNAHVKELFIPGVDIPSFTPQRPLFSDNVVPHVSRAPSVSQPSFTPTYGNTTASDRSSRQSADVQSEHRVRETFAGTTILHHTPAVAVDTESSAFSEKQHVTVVAPEYQVIGCLKNTYLLVETYEGLLMIDQHAAHERVLFDQLEGANAVQEPIALLFPECIALTEDDYAYAEKILPDLTHLGIQAELWGSNQLKVTALARSLKNVAVIEVIMPLIVALRKTDAVEVEEAKRAVYRDIRAMIACKAAVKAGDVLTRIEIEGLIASYLATPNRMTCPHGRPTSWLVSCTQIERTFRRT